MNVVDHEPHFWFLFSRGDALFLDVNCEHSAVSYSVLIQLDPFEVGSYKEQGRTYLSKLAEAVNYSAPGARGSNSPYKARNVAAALIEETQGAISSWRAAQS